MTETGFWEGNRCAGVFSYPIVTEHFVDKLTSHMSTAWSSRNHQIFQGITVALQCQLTPVLVLYLQMSVNGVHGSISAFASPCPAVTSWRHCYVT